MSQKTWAKQFGVSHRVREVEEVMVLYSVLVHPCSCVRKRPSPIRHLLDP